MFGGLDTQNKRGKGAGAACSRKKTCWVLGTLDIKNIEEGGQVQHAIKKTLHIWSSGHKKHGGRGGGATCNIEKYCCAFGIVDIKNIEEGARCNTQHI